MYNFKKTWLLSILIPLGVGAVSSFLVMNKVSDYGQLTKPPFSPPGFVFPVVWTLLYILMGIGSALVACSRKREKYWALTIYAVQLAVNFFWTIFFFKMQWRLFSFFWILLLIALVAAMIKEFLKISRPAGLLQIPYLLWLAFAAYLNLGIWYLNR